MDVMALQVQLVVLSIAKYFTNIANIFKIFSKQFANILQVMQIFCEWMWVELYLLHRAGHLIVYQATLLKSLTLKKNTHTLDCWSKIKSQKSNTEYQKISMGVLLPFIRARLTIQCDSWTSAKPDGGKTMPSKLEQTDKGTPFSRDFPTIIFDTFLTWIIPCVFPNNAYKIGTDGQRETLFKLSHTHTKLFFVILNLWYSFESRPSIKKEERVFYISVSG